MSEGPLRQSITVDGVTLRVGETELFIEETFMGVSSGIRMRVERICDDGDGSTNVTMTYVDGAGPTVDAPAGVVANAIGAKLSRIAE